MRKLNQTGSLLLPLVIVSVLLLGMAGFGAWAFMSRQDYKNNSDYKATAAARDAAAAEAEKQAAEFAEKEKSPLKTYTGPTTYGSIKFNFPKTWDRYESTESSNLPVNNYFYPDYVPDTDANQSFALRLQVSNQTNAAVLKTFDTTTKAGTSVVAPFSLAKMPEIVGAIVTGEIGNKKKGVLVVLPLRDKTIIIWTEGANNTTDFMNTVLPSLEYAP